MNEVEEHEGQVATAKVWIGGFEGQWVEREIEEHSFEMVEEILDGIALMIQNRCYSGPMGAAALIRSILRELASALLLAMEEVKNEE